MKRLALFAAVIAVMAAAVAVAGGVANAHNNAAIHISPGDCTLFNGNGALVFGTGSGVSNNGGQTIYQCFASGVANNSGKAVSYDTNNNPFGPGTPCAIMGTPAGTVMTADWRENVSASGNAVMTCHASS
jgi:hypothetical protein